MPEKLKEYKSGSLGLFYTHSVEFSNLLNCANLPNLQNRRLLDVATLMYTMKYGFVPSNVVDIFSVKSSKYHLGNMDFHLPRFNSAHYGKHSIQYFGPYVWSRLDSKIKDKPTLQSFKSSIWRINVVDLISIIVAPVLFAGPVADQNFPSYYTICSSYHGSTRIRRCHCLSQRFFSPRSLT